MIDDILYFFNLKPEEVQSSAVSHYNNTTTYVDITLNRKPATCPHCGGAHVYAHGFALRLLKHPILYDTECIIRYHSRRFKCQYCKSTFFEYNPFAHPNTSYTLYTYQRIFKELKNPRITFKQVAIDVGLSITQIINLFDNLGIALRRPLPKVVCIDEFYDPKTGSGSYNCVFMDWSTGEVVDVISNRKKYYLQSYLQNIPKSERDKVEIISIDMWNPYRDIAKLYFKNAKIAVDSFHVIKNLNKALDDVRLKVMRKFDSKSNEYYLLNKFAWLIEMNYENIHYNKPKYNRKLRMSLNHHEILNMILKIDDELTQIHNFKEMYRYFNKHCPYEEGREKLAKLINAFKLSGIKELQKVSNMLSNWFDEIVNSLIRIEGRRVSNGPIESLNSRIRTILKNACGYRNFERERNRIFYCFNEKWIAKPQTKIRFIKRSMYQRGPYKKRKT